MPTPMPLVLVHKVLALVLLVALRLAAFQLLVLLASPLALLLLLPLLTTTTTHLCLFPSLTKTETIENASTRGRFFLPNSKVFTKLTTVHPLVRSFLLLVTSIGLSACASNFSAAYDMYKALEQPNPERFASFEMNPNFQYLEAHSPASQAMLVLGYTTAPENQPAIQTWYDSEQQLLRLQNGFLVSLTGVANTVSTTEYTWGPPTAQGVQLPTAKTYSQPGQQVFNKTVPLAFQQVPASAVSTKNSVLRTRIAQQNPNLLWYQQVQSTAQQLPFSLHAFAANGTPVYGSQCLTPSECVEWLYRSNANAEPNAANAKP